MNSALRALACLLLSGTAALASSDLDHELASTPRLRAAAEAACDLTDLITVPAFEMADPYDVPSWTPAEVKKSADWLARYNLFAFSLDAALLADYAHLLTVWKGPESRLKDAECKVLMPAYDVAVTTGQIVEPSKSVFASPIVGNGPNGLKINPDLAAVAQRCETSEHEDRYVKWCRKDQNGVRGGKPF